MYMYNHLSSGDFPLSEFHILKTVQNVFRLSLVLGQIIVSLSVRRYDLRQEFGSGNLGADSGRRRRSGDPGRRRGVLRCHRRSGQEVASFGATKTAAESAA